MQDLEAAVRYLVEGIVTHPEDVKVTSTPGAKADLISITVNPEDLGRVIGRGGKTANALRTVVAALAKDKRVRVDVVDVNN